MINVKQMISLSGDSIKNEDLIWYGPRDVVVLDGSTSLSPSKLNAVWFVERFCSLYAEAIQATDDICSAINQTLEAVFEAFKEALNDSGSVAPEFYPSASGLFFHVKGDQLQIVTIGDCSADIYLLDEPLPMNIYDPQVSTFDQQVFDAMLELRAATGENICDLVNHPDVRSILVQNRSSMNTDMGYRILSFGMAPCTPEEIISIPLNCIRRIVAYTDGFEDVAYLMDCSGLTLEEAGAALRQAEEQDHLLNENVRFKVHDDASAIEFEVTGA